MKRVWNKKLLYKGHKVVPWCPRCGTSLSSHELAQGYKEVEENSVYVKFRLKPSQKIGKFTTDNQTFIVAWTTTPWTLPGNVALAVGDNISYVIEEYSVKKPDPEGRIKNNDKLIWANGANVGIFENANFPNEGIEARASFVKARDLIGLEYEPLFNIPALKDKKAYKVYSADFVTTEDGTGVVHTAVMYGVDDYNLGKKIGLPEHHLVDERGLKKSEVPGGLGGLYVKDKATEEKTIKYLRSKNLLLKTELYKHDYPFCWRCDTPLLYYARDSWFVAMSKLKKKLLTNNSKINWVPANVKNGRFGEWLRDVNDWNFSRERYWGTPLPIWACDKCGVRRAIGGVQDLEKAAEKSRNHYILVRHGQAESNIREIDSSYPEPFPNHLTFAGKVEAEKLAKKLAGKRVGFIYASDITRTKETAEAIKAKIPGAKLFFDERLREINVGELNGRPMSEYDKFYPSYWEAFMKRPAGGENLTDLKRRVYEFLETMEKKHDGKTIVVVSHEYPIWMMATVMNGWSDGEAISEKEKRGDDFVETGGSEAVVFRSLPRDENGSMDLHRPYIDGFVFDCDKCGGEMQRVKEVVDVWFDSGAMPFAQVHYPFDGKSKLEFPANYISEAVDQTRGWFYTLLAVATLLGKGAPYENVICLGHILDKNGQKMSKSKGNVVDPWVMINKYGADAVRWYFYTVNPPGEPKRFNEADLGKASSQFIALLYNSFVFWKTYADKSSKLKLPNPKSMNVLDKWILARLNEIILSVTKKLDKYEANVAAREIEEFVGDLSRWYIRRSRRRFQPARAGGKPESQRDYAVASAVLGYVLLETSKLIAPFTPFFAEALYKSFHTDNKLSVHLENWSKGNSKFSAKGGFASGGKIQNSKLLADMAEVRKIATAALAKRAEAGIKVRQPLSEIKIKGNVLKGSGDLLEVLKEEINVKRVLHEPKLKEEVWLNTEITHELREEGWLRDLVRIIQQMRQDGKFEPKDKLILIFESPAKELVYLMEKNETLIKKEVGAKAVEYRKSPKFHIELETKLDNWPLWLGLRKPQ